MSAVIITGAGNRSFCEGVDPEEAGRFFASPSAYRRFLVSVRNLYLLFQAVPKPVIAAVNGKAQRGGPKLAMACDIIVASSTARLGDGHPGGIGGGGVAARLPLTIGARNARWLMFTGDLLDAERASQVGLVQQVYPADRFTEDVVALAELVVAHAMGDSMARIKALTFDQPALSDLHREMDESIRQYFDPVVQEELAKWQASELA